MRSIGVAVLAGAVGVAGGLALGWVAWAHDSARPADDSAVVAEYRGGRITAAELQAYLRQRGNGGGAAGEVLEDRKKALAELARERALADAARENAVNRRPEVAGALRRLLADAYMAHELSTMPSPTDAEVKAAFEAQRASFERPQRFRVAHILVAADEASRPKKRKEAEALRASVGRDLGEDYYAFRRTARERSGDEATRATGGELPWMTRAELAATFGDEAVELAAQTRIGDLLPRLVESNRGFHIVRLVAHEPEKKAELADVAAALRARAVTANRAKKTREVHARVDQALELRIVDEEALIATK